MKLVRKTGNHYQALLIVNKKIVDRGIKRFFKQDAIKDLEGLWNHRI